MRHHFFTFAAWVFPWLFFLVAGSCPSASTVARGGVDDLIRNRIEAGRLQDGVWAGKQRIHAHTPLARLYEQRGFKPLWVDGSRPQPQANTMVRLVEATTAEGLRPEDYHLEAIRALLARADAQWPATELVDLDLLLSDAFLLIAGHLHAGRVDPAALRASFHAARTAADVASVLQDNIDSEHLEAALKSFAPQHDGYVKLNAALANYRDIAAAGGWPAISAQHKLRKGDRDASVVALRQRLGISGDLPPGPWSDESLFDEVLEQGVRAFQERHGIDADGVVGPATVAALNTSAAQRVRQIELNLERWRWLPEDFGKRYILVNAASYSLEVVENGQVVMDMRVVVGKPYRDTPVFSGSMTYLVLNPYWHIPPNMAVRDKLPLIRKDPQYLVREKIRVLQGWGSDAKEIDPSAIDWSSVGAGRFPYRLRQDPGPKNALGQVKFMFPNRFNVYLHDTPSKELFAKTERSFSSGCIRIEKPIELAEYLLRGDPKYTRESILAIIARGTERTVQLAEPVPVHLLYWTAWVDRNGRIHFRKDIYGRDKRLDAAL